MCIAATTSGTVFLLEWIYFDPTAATDDRRSASSSETNDGGVPRILTDIVVRGQVILPAEVFSSPVLHLLPSSDVLGAEDASSIHIKEVSPQRIVAKVYVGCRDDHVYCIDVMW